MRNELRVSVLNMYYSRIMHLQQWLHRTRRRLVHGLHRRKIQKYDRFYGVHQLWNRQVLDNDCRNDWRDLPRVSDKLRLVMQ
jgi:hypothetical protein